MPRVTIIEDDPNKSVTERESPTIAVTSGSGRHTITVVFQTRNEMPPCLCKRSASPAGNYECVVTADGETVSGIIASVKRTSFDVDTFQSTHSPQSTPVP